MNPKKKTFSFHTVLSETDALFMRYVIYLPEEVVNQLPAGRVRVEGTVNGAPMALAVQHLKDGSRYFSVSAALRRAARVAVGGVVKVKFNIVDPGKLEVPEELEAVLSQDDDARKAWDKLTTGYQRSLIHYITSVKNVDSRIKRSLDLLNRAKEGRLHGQQKK